MCVSGDKQGQNVREGKGPAKAIYFQKAIIHKRDELLMTCYETATARTARKYQPNWTRSQMQFV